MIEIGFILCTYIIYYTIATVICPLFTFATIAKHVITFIKTIIEEISFQKYYNQDLHGLHSRHTCDLVNIIIMFKIVYIKKNIQCLVAI